MKTCLYESESINLWVFSRDQKMLEITEKEKEIAGQLSKHRSEEYKFSRGYTRHVLGKLFNIKPLEIPLIANLGEAPVLPAQFGFLSISHTIDALAVSWSNDKVGVDIERFDRKLHSPILLRKYLNDEKHFKKFTGNDEKIRQQILNIWVVKEALVKRERSSIAYGFKNWNINVDFKYAKNKINKNVVLVKKFLFKNWIIGIASDRIKQI